MIFFKTLGNVLFIILFHVSFVPPYVICSSLEVTIDNHNTQSNFKNKGSLVHDKLSHEMINSIKLHGILLWVSMGFLMPMGIIFIRMANKANENGRKVKVFFYLHVIFQIVAVGLATIEAIMSLRTLENSFDNNHQRLGLALYAAMWLQFLTGVFKPSRGSKRKLKWFLLHWVLGTIVSILGIINIYTGIKAYQKKTSPSNRDSSLWTILFTSQVFCLVLFYLIQDKWEHFQKQRVVIDELNNHQNNNLHGSNDQIVQVVTRNDNEHNKVMVHDQPCRKSNALVNLFKLI